MELSLHSGAEYEVFLLVHVKDDTIPIYSDDNTVQRLKEIYIPAEFRNMTIFFNNKLLEAWYPKVEEHRYGVGHAPWKLVGLLTRPQPYISASAARANILPIISGL